MVGQAMDYTRGTQTIRCAVLEVCQGALANEEAYYVVAGEGGREYGTEENHLSPVVVLPFIPLPPPVDAHAYSPTCWNVI